MKVKIKLAHPEARVPTYATDGSQGFDLYAVCPEIVQVLPGGVAVISTGVAFEVPPGHGLFILSRSGHGFKNGVRLCNSVGLLDSDYRDQLRVGLHNDSEHPFYVRHGDRVAQAVILPVPRCEFEVVEELSDTERGLGGFGSTGR